MGRVLGMHSVGRGLRRGPWWIALACALSWGCAQPSSRARVPFEEGPTPADNAPPGMPQAMDDGTEPVDSTMDPATGDPGTPGVSDAGQGSPDPASDAAVPPTEPDPVVEDAAAPDDEPPPTPDGVIEHGADPTRASASTDGEFEVGQITSGIRDGSAFADNPTIYYPTDAPAPLSLIALIPGFGAGSFYVRRWAPFLASHGFAVILLDPNSNFDNTGQRADALLDAVESLKAENTRAASPLQGMLDVDRVALTGHSMGGGGSHIAANRTPSLKAIVPLNPWNQGTDFSMTTVPTLDLAGSNDSTAPAQQHARPFYDSIPDTTPKMYIEIAGGDHNIADNPDKSEVLARYALSWFKVFLDGDERYRAFLLEEPDGVTPNGFASTL